MRLVRLPFPFYQVETQQESRWRRRRPVLPCGSVCYH
jgi:hypothetical protein